MEPTRDPRRPHDPVRAAAQQAGRENERMVLTPTESRQGSPKRMNLRVLIVSLVILGAVGLALTTAYWGTAVDGNQTPPGETTASPAVPPAN